MRPLVFVYILLVQIERDSWTPEQVDMNWDHRKDTAKNL